MAPSKNLIQLIYLLFKYFLFFSFCSIMLLFAVAQTPWAKNIVKKRLVTWASTYGIDLTIEKVDGCLPFEWRLQKVHLSTVDFPAISCKEMQIRLKILPLLIGQIDCSHLRIHQGLFYTIPFEGRASFSGSEMNHLSLENEYIALSGRAVIADKEIRALLLHFTCSKLSTLQPLLSSSIEGSCAGELVFDSQELRAEIAGESLKIENFTLDYPTLTLLAKPGIESWEGIADLKSSHEEIPLSMHVDFRALHKDFLISVEKALLSAPKTNATAKFHCISTVKEWEGTVSASCEDLKAWRRILPESYLSGALQLDLARANKKLSSSIKMQSFHCFQLAFDQLELKMNLEDDRGILSIIGEKGSFHNLSIAKLETISEFLGQEADFQLQVEGACKGPVACTSSGHISFHEGGCLFHIPKLEGFALKKAFHLEEPVAVEWSPSRFSLHPLHLKIGLGTLNARIYSTAKHTEIKAEAKECPLDFLSFAFPSLTVSGMGSALIDLHGNQETLQGACHLLVDWTEITPYGRPLPLRAKGSLQIHFDQNQAQIHALVHSEKNQFFDLTTSLPILYQPFPLQLTFDRARSFSSILTAEVDLEEILHFVNIGPQHLQGRFSTRLLCNNQGLHGEVELREGLYENYVSGGVFKEIAAKGVAHQQTITIHSLTASDESKQGFLTGTGRIELFPIFSFLLEGDLKHFQAVANETIKGSVDGHLMISGNSKEAVAKGELEVVEAHFYIPDRLSPQVPELKVTFINPPDTLVQREACKEGSFLLLDLEINASKHIFVEGRGLNCEFKGKLHLSGTPTSIGTSGTLSLLKGEYLFCGKMFNLTTAELIFKEKPISGISVSLAGSCALPDLTARVNLHGPLSAPSLLLHSIPQLPANQILARLLFNKDVSEISPIQALQLAQTLFSLSGDAGPSDLFEKVRKTLTSPSDLFEKVRKTLHVDRLTLLTSENDPGKVSLQISKYLTRSILLTLIQGANSRNLAVDIELMRGFLLQAEINEKQQSKFSLKWHHHY